MAVAFARRGILILFSPYWQPLLWEGCILWHEKQPVRDAAQALRCLRTKRRL